MRRRSAFVPGNNLLEGRHLMSVGQNPVAQPPPVELPYDPILDPGFPNNPHGPLEPAPPATPTAPGDYPPTSPTNPPPTMIC